MKKLLLTLALVLGATTMSAQEVGSMWIGGSVGITSTKVTDGDRTTDYRILPEIGYVVGENLGIGVRLGYAHSSAYQMGDLDLGKANTFTIAPFVRYTFLKGDIGGLFVDGGVAYSNVNIKAVDDKLNNFEIGFRPGVAFNVTEKVSLLGHYGFIGYEYGKMGDAKVNSFGLNLDMSQFTIGMNVAF